MEKDILGFRMRRGRCESVKWRVVNIRGVFGRVRRFRGLVYRWGLRLEEYLENLRNLVFILELGVGKLLKVFYL